jgi:DNA modification methylase
MEINKIYLGDSYELIKQIEDNSIDCIYTDVPYLYTFGGAGLNDFGQRLQKRKDQMNKINIRDGFDFSILKEFMRISKVTNMFIWCSQLQIRDILNLMYEYDKTLRVDILTWNKLNPPPMTNQKWLTDIEYCLYFRGKKMPFNDGYNLKSKWFTSSINKKDKDLYNHPTIKPLDLVKRHLLHTTQPDDLILDCFSGSGTTCVAAKELGRHYIGIEIDPTYHKISVDRLNGITANGQTSIFTDFNRGDAAQ